MPTYLLLHYAEEMLVETLSPLPLQRRWKRGGLSGHSFRCQLSLRPFSTRTRSMARLQPQRASYVRIRDSETRLSSPLRQSALRGRRCIVCGTQGRRRLIFAGQSCCGSGLLLAGGPTSEPKQVFRGEILRVPSEREMWTRRSLREEYTLGQVLGQGQFGIVYKARRKRDGAHAAVKSMDRRRANMSALQNEINA